MNLSYFENAARIFEKKCIPKKIEDAMDMNFYDVIKIQIFVKFPPPAIWTPRLLGTKE